MLGEWRVEQVHSSDQMIQELYHYCMDFFFDFSSI